MAMDKEFPRQSVESVSRMPSVVYDRCGKKGMNTQKNKPVFK